MTTLQLHDLHLEKDTYHIGDSLEMTAVLEGEAFTFGYVNYSVDDTDPGKSYLFECYPKKDTKSKDENGTTYRFRSKIGESTPDGHYHFTYALFLLSEGKGVIYKKPGWKIDPLSFRMILGEEGSKEAVENALELENTPEFDAVTGWSDRKAPELVSVDSFSERVSKKNEHFKEQITIRQEEAGMILASASFKHKETGFVFDPIFVNSQESTSSGICICTIDTAVYQEAPLGTYVMDYIRIMDKYNRSSRYRGKSSPEFIEGDHRLNEDYCFELVE